MLGGRGVVVLGLGTNKQTSKPPRTDTCLLQCLFYCNTQCYNLLCTILKLFIMFKRCLTSYFTMSTPPAVPSFVQLVSLLGLFKTTDFMEVTSGKLRRQRSVQERKHYFNSEHCVNKHILHRG